VNCDQGAPIGGKNEKNGRRVILAKNQGIERRCETTRKGRVKGGRRGGSQKRARGVALPRKAAQKGRVGESSDIPGRDHTIKKQNGGGAESGLAAKSSRSEKQKKEYVERRREKRGVGSEKKEGNGRHGGRLCGKEDQARARVGREKGIGRGRMRKTGPGTPKEREKDKGAAP